ncbi:SpoIID/LytB domain-containing protein [Nocardia sp. NPDC052001]|uniref:SpoIID/LytB domain-containing protein n=1 Tax=Nocardia sp. NPDC052001 TaxID=3154853 RepID=UPI00341FB42E
MPNGHLHQRRRRRRLLALSVAACTLGGATAGLLWAWPDEEYEFVNSPGHGRGLSQNGAFDRAVGGNTAETILAHYYPGAQLDTLASVPVRVRLMGLDDKTLDVESETGLYVAGRRVVPGQAAHLTPTAAGADVTITQGCDGAVLWEGTTDDPYAYPLENGSNRPKDEHLELCEGSNYRGVLGVALDGNSSRVINEVDLEDYLLGVVPAEMVPNWADEGGSEALRAQAIAARSYVLAEQRYPYAQTCDTTDCQAYPGTDKEDARTTAAVQSTAGQVLVHDNHILRAEYSAAPDGGIPSIDNLEVGPALSEFQSAPTLIDPTVPTYTDPGYTDPTLGDPSGTDPGYSNPAAPHDPAGAILRSLADMLAPQPRPNRGLSPASHFGVPGTLAPTTAPVIPGNTVAPSTASTPTPPAASF